VFPSQSATGSEEGTAPLVLASQKVPFVSLVRRCAADLYSYINRYRNLKDNRGGKCLLCCCSMLLLRWRVTETAGPETRGIGGGSGGSAHVAISVQRSKSNWPSANPVYCENLNRCPQFPQVTKVCKDVSPKRTLREAYTNRHWFISRPGLGFRCLCQQIVGNLNISLEIEDEVLTCI
jgi:hypothetical protein